MADRPDHRARRPGAAEGAVPATHDQREAAIERLTEAFADDALDIDEFENRVAEAYRAATRADLARLTADLPRAGSRSLAVRRVSPDAMEPMPTRISGLFSSVERGGDFVVPPRLEIRSRFANIELDLRSAWFLPGVTVIDIRAVLGNVEIQLPPDVFIGNEGEWVLSSVSVQRKPAPDDDDDDVEPVSIVRITGRAVLSNVEITGKEKRKRRKK